MTNFSLLFAADVSWVSLKSAAKSNEKLVNQNYAVLILDALKMIFFCPTAPSQTDWKNQCSASIISDTVLLTAAHCLRNHNSKDFQVLLGQSHLNSETFVQYRQLVSISRIEQHPKYDNKGRLLKGLAKYKNLGFKELYYTHAII